MDFLIDLPNEQSTKQLACQFSRWIQAPFVLGLSGEIGFGKSTFIRALFRAMGVQETIKSPTYTLIESYQVDDLHLYHFDLYRIQDDIELEHIGFREYFDSTSICCIEWPERSSVCVDLQLTLTLKGKGRVVNMQSQSERGTRILSLLQGVL